MLKTIVMFVMFLDQNHGYKCHLHSLVNLMEYKMANCELYKQYAPQQYRQSRIRKMLHTQHQECHLLRYWDIYDLHEGDVINEWEVSWIIFLSESS